ncbi:hypothetical protein P4S73_17120 [Paraglaciecola sp. Hal342]
MSKFSIIACGPFSELMDDNEFELALDKLVYMLERNTPALTQPNGQIAGSVADKDKAL